MLSRKELKKCPKDDHALSENLVTQPYEHQKIFANPHVITEGWYPVCKSSELKSEQAKSFAILKQRIVIYRAKSLAVNAMDAFCPHIGADLGNGLVVGERLQCLFHKWEFNSAGKLVALPCQDNTKIPDRSDLQAYPTEEKYGFIWVYAGVNANYAVPSPPGIGGELSSLYVKRIKLKVHQHVLMSNAVDLSHFKTLHKLDAKFDYEVETESEGIFRWDMQITTNNGAWPVKLARKLLGNKISYRVRFAGGSITGITVSMPGLFNNKGPKFPSINIIWGSCPTQDGVGEIFTFLVVQKYQGFFSWVKRLWAYFISFSVLTLLRDDDIFVYPHMRFKVGQLTPADASLSKMIKLFNSLKSSPWSNHKKIE
jgi:nitrite reductase/ring-hydroxylating ferredoxin subunit